MQPLELRDPDLARSFVLQSLWLQRALPPTPESATRALMWAFELANAGEPVPPLCFVADVGHVALGMDMLVPSEQETLHIPGLPPGVARTYEDYVLGKLYADMSFERGADALCRYQGRDRDKGLAFLLHQFQQRADYLGVLLNPAILKSLLQETMSELLSEGWQSLERDCLLPELFQEYQQLIQCVRNIGEILGAEDIFELEHGTALAQFGQRVALRQVLRMADRFEQMLPHVRTMAMARRYDVPTHIMDEDYYPVGGFSSLSNRGTIESLLHSQLAFMEREDRPDLFDIKFLRDELLYYSRDENQFLRRRQSFLFGLYPDLTQARFKDAELPYQRIIMLLGFLVATVRRLTQWLSEDALVFEFCFLDHTPDQPLAPEWELLEMIFREQMANGTVRLQVLRKEDWEAYCEAQAKRSMCRVMPISVADREIEPESTIVTRVRLNSPELELGWPREEIAKAEGHDAWEVWTNSLQEVVETWA